MASQNTSSTSTSSGDDNGRVWDDIDRRLGLLHTDRRLVSLQVNVLAAIELLAEPSTDGSVLVMNPYLWKQEDMHSVYNDPSLRRLCEWNWTGWPVLSSFLVRHPNLNADHLRLAYHGAKNSYRATHILFEGLDPEHRRGNYTSAFFGVNLEAVRDYGKVKYGEIVLFVIPKSACSTPRRSDGAFTAQECDALPVAIYIQRSNWTFSDLMQPSRKTAK